MARELYARIDAVNLSSGLVRSFYDDATVDPPEIVRGDLSKWRVHCLKANPLPTPGRPHVYVASAPAELTIGAGIIDAAPTGGTFTITDPNAAQTTAAIAFDASAAAVQSAIQAALTSNFGSATVSGSAGGPWTIDRGVTGAYAFDLTANTAGIIPSGSTAQIKNTQNGTSLINEKWQLRLKKALPFYNATWDGFAGVTTAGTLVQAGSSTARKVYTLTWNSDAVGGATYWLVSDGSTSSTIEIPYNATADEVVSAFAAHSGLDDTAIVSVVQNGPGSYTILFPLALANGPTIGATASSNTLVVPVGYEADIGVATNESDEILAGETDADVTFEMEVAEESGEPRTICRETTKLYADLLLSSGQTTGDQVFVKNPLVVTTDETGLTVTTSFDGLASNPLIKLNSTNASFSGPILHVIGYDGDVWFRLEYDGRMSCAAGTAASPGINFNTNSASSDEDTGIYWISANTLGISTGGTLRATWSSAGLLMGASTAVQLVAGDATTPAINFGGNSSDTNTGIYAVGADQIGVACGGANVATWSSTGLAAPGTFTANSANTLGKAILGGLPADPVNYGGLWFGVTPDASNYSFLGTSGQTFLNAATTLSLRIGNNDGLVLNGSRVQVTLPIKLKGYTVATLPGSPSVGDTAYVTDATAPTYNGALTGGGAVTVPVFYNGASWVSA